MRQGLLYEVVEKAVMAEVADYHGFQLVKHTPKSCCRKSCRIYHWYNYLLKNNTKNGTSTLEGTDVLFVTNATGF